MISDVAPDPAANSARDETVDDNSRNERELVYSAESWRGTGLQAWQGMVREIWEARELTWRLVLRDFSARYRQSVLGYLWAVLPALITVATFTWLSRANVLPIGRTSLPYTLYVLLGITVWQLFGSGLTGATQCLVNAGSLITKVSFPRETLVLASMGQAIVEFIFRLVLVVIALAYYRVMPSWSVLLVPVALLPLCFFTLGLGFLLALLNGVTRDAGQVVGFALTFWMFLTPIVYPTPTGRVQSLINVVNPVSPFVIATRDLLAGPHLTQPGNFAIGCVVSALIFLFGWRVFHLSEPRIAERI